MAGIQWAVGLSLLMQACCYGVGQTTSGCMKWRLDGNNVCCDICHPGNRLVKECGPSPKDLCTPCGPDTFTVRPKHGRCGPCTQCVGALVKVKGCTATTDTQCGCKEGLTCGNDVCSFCVKTCDKGQEPTENRSCRPCPDGTFNDQSHQKCKPWSTTCPKPDQIIVAKGDAFHDIKCDNESLIPPFCALQHDNRKETWPGLSVAIGVHLLTISISIFTIAIVTVKINQRRKKVKKTITRTPIIRTPTDDPRTLIAIECSFHEAEQEGGSSSRQTGWRPTHTDAC